MKQSEEHFSAETIDEQIDQITNKSDQHQHTIEAQNATNAQLVRDLQTLAHNEAQLLAEIRERLANAYEESRTIKQTIKDTPAQLIQFQAHAEKKQPVKRRIVQILSGLVAALIIGSVLTILIGNNSHSGQSAPLITPPDYYTFTNGHLIRVDATSGAIRWEYLIHDLTPEVTSHIPFTIRGDTVYIVDVTTEYAINKSNGSLRWSKHYSDNYSRYIPVIANDMFYIAEGKAQKIDAFRLSDAKPTQSYNIPLASLSFAIANNVLYAWNDSRIYAIKLDNRQILWTQPLIEMESHSLPGLIISTGSNKNVYINDNTIYIKVALNKQSAENSILALNATTGVRIGQTPLFIPDIPVFTTNNYVVYYTSHAPGAPYTTLHAYNTKIEQEIWQKNFDGMTNIPFAANDKTVIVDCEDPVNAEAPSKVVILDTKSGAIKWQYSVQTQIANPSIENALTQTDQGLIMINITYHNKDKTQNTIITPEGKVIRFTYNN